MDDLSRTGKIDQFQHTLGILNRGQQVIIDILIIREFFAENFKDTISGFLVVIAVAKKGLAGNSAVLLGEKAPESVAYSF
jgi:hypothetical protein